MQFLKQRTKNEAMKSPIHSNQQIARNDAENLRQQYQELFRKHEKESTEFRKSLLLTPFLLSIPVIIILFILISGSNSGIPNTVTAEPLQTEVVTITPVQKAKKMNVATITNDSLAKSDNTVSLPTGK
jgi:hypothetical protein